MVLFKVGEDGLDFRGSKDHEKSMGHGRCAIPEFSRLERVVPLPGTIVGLVAETVRSSWLTAARLLDHQLCQPPPARPNKSKWRIATEKEPRKRPSSRTL